MTDDLFLLGIKYRNIICHNRNLSLKGSPDNIALRSNSKLFSTPYSLSDNTIGSFLQTIDVRTNRSAYKNGKISKESYINFNMKKIADCIALQEKLGLDVLVHGEFERNDKRDTHRSRNDSQLVFSEGGLRTQNTRRTGEYRKPQTSCTTNQIREELTETDK